MYPYSKSKEYCVVAGAPQEEYILDEEGNNLPGGISTIF
jgi:hypothetical protein